MALNSVKFKIPQDGFFDEFIQGGRGAYYFQIELPRGRQIAGGYFHYKSEARNELRRQMQHFLRDPIGFFTDATPRYFDRHKRQMDRYISKYERPRLIASRSE
jgi:hypothetical protein